jgi:hypothetical protein
MYERMEDGPRIAHRALVLSFVAIDNGQARLTSLRQSLLRRLAVVVLPSSIHFWFRIWYEVLLGRGYEPKARHFCRAFHIVEL